MTYETTVQEMLEAMDRIGRSTVADLPPARVAQWAALVRTVLAERDHARRWFGEFHDEVMGERAASAEVDGLSPGPGYTLADVARIEEVRGRRYERLRATVLEVEDLRAKLRLRLLELQEGLF